MRYLESRLIARIKAAKRAKLTNGTAPTFDLLPESDRSDMEFFVEQIAVILPVLGLDFMQAPPVPPAQSKPADAATQTQFEMVAVGVKADAIEVDGEFVVLKGSQARRCGAPSWTSYKGLRDALLAENKLVESTEPNTLTFADNVPFSSPSAAAAVVFAGSTSGRVAWKVKGTVQTYKDWQASQLPTSAEPAA